MNYEVKSTNIRLCLLSLSKFSKQNKFLSFKNISAASSQGAMNIFLYLKDLNLNFKKGFQSIN